MRISDWSSDVCSSDLHKRALAPARSWSATGSRHRRRSGGGNWGNSWHYSFTAGGWPVGRGENGGAQHVGGPVEPAMAQPVRGKILRAVRLDQRRDRELVRFRRGGGKGDRNGVVSGKRVSLRE